MNLSILSFGHLEIAFFVALIITLISISLLRPIALSINLTDTPNKRKKHIGMVPLIGGIAMFFGFSIGILISDINFVTIKYFLLSSLIVVITGALDDHHDISVNYRFFFQISTALIVTVIAGVNIESIGDLFSRGDEILLNQWSVLVTVIAIIVAMNALNMSDGINGLAGLTSFFTFLALAFLSNIEGNLESLITASLMCAVILPFLLFNLGIGVLSSKQIFMGDAGSMFLGLGIVWLLVQLSQGEFKAFSPVIALWLFAFPLIDGTSTVLRRIIKGKSPFKPDLSHLHHVLQLLGLNHNIVLLIIVLFSILMSLIGIIGALYEIPEWIMFFGFISTFILFYISKNFLIIKYSSD